MIDADILIEEPAWDALELEQLASSVFTVAVTELGLGDAGLEVSLLACNDARICALNTEFRGKPAPTNVLSWPSEERAAATAGEMPDLPQPAPDGPPEELGDIAIAFETCAREAEEAGKPIEDHVAHLLVHGLLHLLGFDHETEEDAALMEGLETRILARLGVPDPY